MTELRHIDAISLQHSCSLVATSMSGQRRCGARLISGDRRGFGLSRNLHYVHVPYPPLDSQWSLRTVTCGIALQCAPCLDELADLPLQSLTLREQRALSLIAGGAALAWVLQQWPGLKTEMDRWLPGLPLHDPASGREQWLQRATELAQSDSPLNTYTLLGRLPGLEQSTDGILAALRKHYGRMPWSSKRRLSQQRHTLPAGGDGTIQNPNLPPPSRPEEDDAPLRADQRPGIPYPEWNAWTRSFMPNHVAVLERRHPQTPTQNPQATVNLRRWFEAPTHRAMKNRLDDGADLDIDQYISYYVDTRSGAACEANIFRDLQPAARDVSTAILLDASASLGVRQGQVFQLELACADALSSAMALARERHGLFVFSGQTRHRVDVICLKDFHDHHSVLPGRLGLAVGGYTRLGAPLRHLTQRLLAQPSTRRLLIIVGDGLMSDEGYEGHYAWADVEHAVDEAEQAGVFPYYIGVGPTRVDPLPDVFGKRRSTRISRVQDLPGALASVHQQLVAI